MKEIPIGEGFVALVDDADYELVSAHKWCMHTIGYACTYIGTPKQEGFLLHRFLVGLGKGDKRCVDHINGNKLDNRRENLRICSHAENMRNRKINKNNTSGFKGVRRNHRGEKWCARIKVDGVMVGLGSYDTREAAHEAYKAAALKYHGEFASFG
jgi:hypothetical protein